MVTWDEIIDLWREALLNNKRLGGQSEELIVEPPASESEIRAVEDAVGTLFPDQFRETLNLFSRRVELDWYLPDGFVLPNELKGIFSGNLSWSLANLAELERDRKEAVKVLYPNPNNAYDAVWHRKLVFQTVANGDRLALDLGRESYGAVVYLGHADNPGHGYVIAANFEEFVERWSLLGCPGGEDWQWLPFTSGRTSGILPECANAKLWRKVIGFEG